MNGSNGTYKLATAISTCPPACRMAVLCGYWDYPTGEPAVRLAPVVALLTREVSYYSRKTGTMHDYRNHEDLVEDGWAFDGMQIETSPLYCSDEDELVYLGQYGSSTDWHRPIVFTGDVVEDRKNEDETRSYIVESMKDFKKKQDEQIAKYKAEKAAKEVK